VVGRSQREREGRQGEGMVDGRRHESAPMWRWSCMKVLAPALENGRHAAALYATPAPSASAWALP